MWYSSAMPFPPSMSLACLAMSRALPQLFLFSMDIISGAALLRKHHFSILQSSPGSFVQTEILKHRQIISLNLVRADFTFHLPTLLDLNLIRLALCFMTKWRHISLCYTCVYSQLPNVSMLTNKNKYSRLEKVSLLFLIDQSSQLQTGLEAESDLCQHICHFLLHQLIPCQWNSKLDSGAGNNDTVSSSRLSINNQIPK